MKTAPKGIMEYFVIILWLFMSPILAQDELYFLEWTMPPDVAIISVCWLLVLPLSL
jgi:hypothetical protein